ncbi:g6953 [Coccomyxa viridis]|uniref:G6953 protein n=1 Tax=Coccomyxa viridis TaxID=1274662 RepID=A0ABP1G1J8_9CHLO
MGTDFKELSQPSEQGSSSNVPRQRKPNYGILLPLVYAPLLPLIRIGLRNRVSPGTRDAVFGAAVLTALAHAGYVMSSDSTM